MTVAVVGSRNLTVRDLGQYLPAGVTQIVSGGAKGVDQCARAYAQEKNIPLLECLPDYPKYGRAAPLRRNEEIVRSADLVLAFWDRRSRGTLYTIRFARKIGVGVRIFYPSAGFAQYDTDSAETPGVTLY